MLEDLQDNVVRQAAPVHSGGMGQPGHFPFMVHSPFNLGGQSLQLGFESSPSSFHSERVGSEY